MLEQGSSLSVWEIKHRPQLDDEEVAFVCPALALASAVAPSQPLQFSNSTSCPRQHLNVLIGLREIATAQTL